MRHGRRPDGRRAQEPYAARTLGRRAPTVPGAALSPGTRAEPMMFGVTLYSFLPALRDSDRYDRDVGRYDRDSDRYDRDVGRYDRDSDRCDRDVGRYDRDSDRCDRDVGRCDRDVGRYDRDSDRYDCDAGRYGRDPRQVWLAARR
jgi:hypothetical protein